MILPLLHTNDLISGIPRESGDDPQVLVFGEAEEEYSPRERG